MTEYIAVIKKTVLANYFVLTGTVILLFILSIGNIQAQQAFLQSGKIEFEKKINVHKSIEDQMKGEADGNSGWLEQMKKMAPEYAISYFNLYFTDSVTLYTPGREYTGQKLNDWMKGPASENTVYSNLNRHFSIAQKQVFENTFIIEDSLRNAEWKITSDTRAIAGIECRKATTIIMDSVFVFAFYTDKLVSSGGPESFNGLPGMILGIAIPRIHTTWFATKVEAMVPSYSDLAPPTKGKKTSGKKLLEQLQSSMNDWAKWAQRAQWAIFL